MYVFLKTLYVINYYFIIFFGCVPSYFLGSSSNAKRLKLGRHKYKIFKVTQAESSRWEVILLYHQPANQLLIVQNCNIYTTQKKKQCKDLGLTV